MIQIYNIENTNFDQNGDMSLLPSSASVHAVLNGIWEYVNIQRIQKTAGSILREQL